MTEEKRTQVLHDFKKIAALMVQVKIAYDKLYKDIEPLLNKEKKSDDTKPI